MTPQEAIQVVAQVVLHYAADDRDLAEWEDYPKISEQDWGAVMDAVADYCPKPAPGRCAEAYALLNARANRDAPIEGEL